MQTSTQLEKFLPILACLWSEYRQGDYYACTFVITKYFKRNSEGGKNNVHFSLTFAEIWVKLDFHFNSEQARIYSRTFLNSILLR